MKLVQNSGTDRVIDLLRQSLTAGCQLYIVTPSFSLFAFSEMCHEMGARLQSSLLLPTVTSELSIGGTEYSNGVGEFRTCRKRTEYAVAPRNALRECGVLHEEIGCLRTLAAKERQILRQVELNLELKRIEAELAATKQKL
jgi:hypothetical protein